MRVESRKWHSKVTEGNGELRADLPAAVTRNKRGLLVMHNKDYFSGVHLFRPISKIIRFMSLVTEVQCIARSGGGGGVDEN